MAADPVDEWGDVEPLQPQAEEWSEVVPISTVLAPPKPPAAPPLQYQPIDFEQQLGVPQYQPKPLSEDARRIKEIVGGVAAPTTQEGVDKHAGILDLARKTNLEFNVVAERFDDIYAHHIQAQEDPEQWIKDYPQLAEWVLRNPKSGVVAKKDVPFGALSQKINTVLGFLLPTRADKAKAREVYGELYIPEAPSLEDAELKPKTEEVLQDDKSKAVNEMTFGGMRAVGERTNEAVAGMNANATAWEIMLRRRVGKPTALLERRQLEYEQASKPRDYEQGEVGRFFSSAFSGTSSSIYGGADAIKMGGAGGLVGGLIGASVGALLGGWEGAADLGKVGFSTGAKLFGGAGLAWGTAKLEGGGFYREALKTKTDDGTPLSEEYAAGGAMVYAVLSTSIEFGHLNPFWKALGPVSDLVKGRNTAAATRELLKNPLFMTSVKRLLKNLATSTAAESGEEALQKWTDDAVKYFVDSVQERKPQKARHGDFGGVDVIGGAEEFVGAIPANLMMAGSGMGANTVLKKSLEAAQPTATILDVASRLKQDGLKGRAALELTLQSMAVTEGRAMESAAVVDALVKFNGQESIAVKASPEEAAEALRAGGLKESVFIDAVETLRFFQESKQVAPDTAAETFIGPGGMKKLTEAAERGEMVEVPLKDFLEKWSGTKLAAALQPHMTVSADLPTPQKLDQAETKAEVERLVGTFEEGGEAAAPKTYGEWKWLESAQKQLAYVTGDAAEARQKMHLFRAWVRTISERMGKDPDELFEQHALDVEAGAAPTARALLEQRMLEPGFSRAEDLFRDEPSGMPNRRAFETRARPAGKKVGVIAVEGIKWLNDNADHKKTDAMTRTIALALHRAGLEAYKVGAGDFALYVADEAELQSIMATVKASLPQSMQGFQLTSMLEQDIERERDGELKKLTHLTAAETLLQEHHDALVKERKRADARPVLRDESGEAVLDSDGDEQVQSAERPYGLPKEGKDKEFAASLEFPVEKPTPALLEELLQKASSLTVEDFFNAAYRDPITGEWTKLAWDKMPRKKNVVSLDLSGLRKANERYGKAWGNLMLESMGTLAQLLGGEQFDFSHHHGDEYSAQSDDPKALEAFVDRLRAALYARPLPRFEKETGEWTYIPLEFHYGYANDYSLETADDELNERKRRIKAARAHGLGVGRRQRVGPAADARGAKGGNQGGPGAPGAASASADQQGGSEGLRGGASGELEAQGSDQRGNDAGRGDSDLGDLGEGALRRDLQTARETGELPEPPPGFTRDEASLGYPRARTLIANAKAHKEAYKTWFAWCVTTKGKGPKPTVPWFIESVMAKYGGVEDPLNGFSGDEQGRDMAGRVVGGKGGRHGASSRESRAGVGLTGRAADAWDNRKSTPMSRNIFTQAPDETTLLYQFPTPEESLARMMEEGVLADHLIERGATPVESAELLEAQLKESADAFGAHTEIVVVGDWRGAKAKAFRGRERLVKATTYLRNLATSGALLAAYVMDDRVPARRLNDARWQSQEANATQNERLGLGNPFVDAIDFSDVAPTIENDEDTGEPLVVEPSGEATELAEFPESKNLPGQADRERVSGAGASGIISGGVIIPKGYTGKVVLDQDEAQDEPMPGPLKDEAGTYSVFHGTRSEFSEFKPSTGGEFGPGIYLAATEGQANFYASSVASGPLQPTVKRIVVTLKNPFVVKKTDWIKMTEKSTPKQVVARLKKKGHDGIIGIGINDVDRQVVAWDPSQVREEGSIERKRDPKGYTGKVVLEQNEKQTETEAFKQWFGKSKVVDANGAPLVVYHGTNASFDAFDTAQGDLGAHFGTAEQANKSVDRMRGMNPSSGPAVVPVYLSIRKPLRLVDEGSFHAWSIADQLAKKRVITKEEAEQFKADGWRKQKANNARVREAIEAAGYDGVVYSNTQEGPGTSWIAFKPTQIKSATGNRGTFDPKSANILRSGPRGYTAIMAAGMNRLFKVVLNPSANHSTFLHESAHIFLHLMQDLAKREDAPKQLKDDYATILKWLDAKSDDDLVVKNQDPNAFDPARERHEKFARGFERYLLDGKSPAKRLVRMFERFRIWLSKVYEDPRMLRVELNPEIRAVFDRMLATDKEIESFKKSMGLAKPPLAKELFETEEDLERYLERRLQLHSDVTRKIDLSVAKDRLREQESWWKAELKKELEAALEEYEALPERRAQQTLAGKGELWGLAGTDYIELAHGLVVEAVGEEGAKKFHTTTKENAAVDPGEVADFFGYATGKEMLEAVLNLAPKEQWASARATEAMAEKHPEVLDSRQELNEQISKGLHGDTTLQHLITEWAALGKKMSKPGDALWAQQVTPISVIAAAAKEYAGRRVVGRIDAGQALRAQLREADLCARAIAYGKYAQAFIHKEKQLLNFFLWRELTQAREERERFIQLAERMARDVEGGRTGRKSTLGKANPIYREGAASLLAAIGLAPEGDGPGASIDDIIKQMEVDNQVVALDPIELEKIEVKPRKWKDMTVAEMRVVRDALANIYAAATGVTTALRGDKLVDFEEQVDRLAAEGANGGPIIPPSNDSGAEFLPELIGGAWQWTDGWMVTPETMLGKWLGNNDIHSDAFQSLVLPLVSAKHKEVALLEGPIRRIVEAFDAMPRTVASKQSQRIDGKALFAGHTDLVGAPQRRWQLLLMLLNMGNAGNMKRLTEGRGITAQQVWDAALKVGITKEEYDWVQSVWDACEDLKKPAFDMEERLNGVRPEEVEAVSFETPFGKYRGGYFPAVYDRRGLSGVGQKQLDSQLMDPHYVPAGTNQNAMKKRAADFSDVISLSPNIIYRHLAAVAHDIAFREAVLSVNRLINDVRVKAMLQRRLGDKRYPRLQEWVKDVARGRGGEGTAGVNPFVAAMQALRGGLAVSVLGGSLQNAAEDLITGLATAVPGSELQAVHLAAGIAAVKDPRMSADNIKRAHEKSGELKSRRNQLSRELLATISKLIARSPLGRGAMRYVKDHAFVVQEQVDKVVSTAIWIAAERQALAKGESEKDAIIFADKIVRGLLPSHHVVDSSALMRSEVLASMLVFFRFFNTAYNIGRRHGPGFFSDMNTPLKAAEYLGYLFAFAILGSLFGRGQGPDKDEPWGQWHLRKMVVGAASKYPWGGELAEFGWNYAMKKLGQPHGRTKDPRNSSILGMVMGIAQLMTKALDGDQDADKRLEAAVRAMGLVLGQPVSQPLKMGMYGYRLGQGDLRARGPGDVAGGFFWGESSRQPANLGTLIEDFRAGGWEGLVKHPGPN